MRDFIMRGVIAAACLTMGACTVTNMADGGPRLTRPIAVPARDVAVFERLDEVKGPYTVVEEVFVRDNGEDSPDELESRLRTTAGAGGANAIVMAPTNRRLNGARVDLSVRLDNPFDYYSATAIWIGDGPPPVKVIRP